MQKQKGIAPIIAIFILAVILVCVGGAYYFKQQQSKQISKSNVIDATADWKTYTAYFTDQYGFEVKYPKGWFVRLAYDDANLRKGILRSCWGQDPNKPYESEIGKITFESQNYPLDFGYNGYLPPNYLTGAILEISITCKTTRPKDKNFVLSKDVNLKIDPRTTVWEIYDASHNGFSYYFYLSIFPQLNATSQEKEKLAKEFSPIFNQILSTFKFTN